MKRWKAVSVLGVVVVAVILSFRPTVVTPPGDAYFDALNRELKSHGPGTPVVLIDLDRLDANLQTLRKKMTPPLSLRVVTKSLPSMELIKYVLDKTGTRKLMEFHAPFIPLLYEHFGTDIDVLMGKPIPVQAVRTLYEGLPALKGSLVTQSVQWLVDTDQRLKDYLGFAAEKQLKLNLNVEIDVGLHRGGVRTADAMLALLSGIQSASHLARFSGFMGYDGHVPFAPTLLEDLWNSKERAIRSAFAKVQGRYSQFLAAAKRQFPDLFASSELTWNGGGSKTYSLYSKDSVITDLSVGSAVLKPVDYDVLTLEDHAPAIFLATPVLKKIPRAEMPFLDSWTRIWHWWDQNRFYAFYLYGGGWAASQVYPYHLKKNPLLDVGTPNENLLPNQSILNGSAKQQLEVGDYIFYRPKQSDAMFQFEEVHLLRNGKLAGKWKVIPRRM